MKVTTTIQRNTPMPKTTRSSSSNEHGCYAAEPARGIYPLPQSSNLPITKRAFRPSLKFVKRSAGPSTAQLSLKAAEHN